MLAGDIGGTKTGLALFALEDDTLKKIASKQYASAAFSNFSDMLNDFKQEHTQTIKAACFGIAGPVIEGACRTTNLPWEVITTQELEETLQTKVVLLNDLSATAYGMLYLDSTMLLELNPHAKTSYNSCAVIAAGTGLGEGILYFDGQKYHPMATEGGHSDFAPQNELEDQLLKWLRQRYPKHVSYERVLCGEGIATLYTFLHEYTQLAQPQKIVEMDTKSDRSAMISHCALEDKDPLCLQSLELFCRLYGAESGNLALKSLAMGGVFIGGGIAPKILPILQNGSFMQAFSAKGRFQSLLETLPVKVSLNPETALLGAAHYAKDRLL